MSSPKITVAELLEKLSKMDPDAVIAISPRPKNSESIEIKNLISGENYRKEHNLENIAKCLY